MNCDRFVFFIAVSVLSNLLNNSLAVEAKASRVNLVVEQTITSVDRIQIVQANRFNNSDRFDEHSDSSQNSTAEKPLVMSKRLGLIGIAIVSLTSLILLKFLFITPTKKVFLAPISSAVRSKGSKAIENNGDHKITDAPQSPVNFEAIPKLTSISLPPVRSSAQKRYAVQEKPRAESFETISLRTVSSPDIPKIDIVVELIKCLQQPNDELRREAIWALTQIGDSRGIEPLTKILSQVNLSDRSLVLEAIIQITKRSFQPIEELLLDTFDDANPEIKQNAIRDLAAVYAFVAPVTKQLARMQVDRDMQVRQSAKLAIEQLNLCYFPCLFDDCPGSAKHDSNSDGKNIN